MFFTNALEDSLLVKFNEDVFSIWPDFIEKTPTFAQIGPKKTPSFAQIPQTGG